MYKKNVQSKNVSVQNDTEKKWQHQPHCNGEHKHLYAVNRWNVQL